jgi:hypothetical protein
MARVGLDLDHVIYKFVDALRTSIHKRTGKPLSEMPPAQTWNFFSDTWNMSLAEYHQAVRDGITDGDLLWRGDMYDNCKQVMEYMYRDRGDHITIITARSYQGIEKLCIGATKYWLDNVAGLPYHELELLDYAGEKTGRSFDVLFDDAPHHIERAIIAGENAVLFDQPWNMHMAYAPRVYGWQGIRNYMDEHFPRNAKLLSNSAEQA